MPRKKFTAPFVEKVQPPADKIREDYYDTILPAFGLRVGKKRKTYFVMVRTLKAGKWTMTRTTLGTTNEIGLADARQQAREAMKRAEQGKAPIEVKRERRAAMEDESRNTFETVAAECVEKYIGRKRQRPAPRTLAEMSRTFASDRLASWRAKPLAQISKRDILDVLDAFVADGHPTAANRMLDYLRMLFKWSLDREIIKVNPCIDVKPPGVEISRDRVLTPEELRAVWQALTPTENRGDLYAGIVKILALTGQRRDEVGGMRWSEIDGDMWSIPGEIIEDGKRIKRTKNGLAHVVPLSAPVLAILEERRVEQRAMQMKTAFVFTSTGKTAFSGWSKSKARLDGRANIAPWRLHDLRRSFVTHSSERLHIAPHIVEAVINHISGVRAGVAGVYNRAQYLDERRKALDAWAAYLLRVFGEVAVDNVVELAG